MSVDTFVIQQEKCVINPPEFYFHKDHLATLGDIANKEVARFFSRGKTDCHNLLRLVTHSHKSQIKHLCYIDFNQNLTVNDCKH